MQGVTVAVGEAVEVAVIEGEAVDVAVIEDEAVDVAVIDTTVGLAVRLGLSWLAAVTMQRTSGSRRVRACTSCRDIREGASCPGPRDSPCVC